MATRLEELKQSLITKCVELGRNDPFVTSLDLERYGKLEWDDASYIAGALVGNTRVRELFLYVNGQHVSSDGLDFSIPLLPFLSSSPSLQSLVVTSNCNYNTAPSTKDSHTTAYILQAISHNKLLVELELDNLIYAKPFLIEEVLAKTQTLEKLIVTEGSQSDSELYHAFRRGFGQNSSIKTIVWGSKGPSPNLGEVFFGLSNHPKLKTLKLSAKLTRASAQALRSCLQANDTLNYFSLHVEYPMEVIEEENSLTPVLLGLACNRGVTHFRISNSPPSVISCATAWAELLQKNTSLEILELSYCSNFRDEMSAIARGLEGNASLQKLKIVGLNVGLILHGPAWQAMLQRNCSLKEIVLENDRRSGGEIPRVDLACFAGGLVKNASLKSLDLRSQCIGNDGIAALVEALVNNYTLESLVIRCSKINGAQGAAAVQNLWRNKTLKYLDLSFNFSREEDEAAATATGFPTDLSRNCVFETLLLCGAGLQSQECRAVCESLQGNSCLQELDISFNHGLSLDVDCATTLNDLLDSTTLRVFKFNGNQVTKEGIELLARGLQSNSSLRELDLQFCEIGNEDLLKLGEALVENSTLEILRIWDGFGEAAVSQFFELLPQMKGLNELCLSHCDVMDNEDLCVAVVDGLRKNTGLQRLTYDGDSGAGTWLDKAPCHVKPLIAFYLNLNRNGRKLLEPPLDSRVPLGLWPHILANMSSPKDTSLLYYFLRKRPSLVVE
jgi:Ran GTPase-activating protein (RanGAP) involved in mRNA processing and transport